MDESEDEAQNPLSEENWMKRNNCKFMKYVIHHRHPMTPEQLKQKPFEEIFKNQHENDTILPVVSLFSLRSNNSKM